MAEQSLRSQEMGGTVIQDQTMHALAWFGNHDVRVVGTTKPQLQELADAIIKVTATSVCSFDMQLYNGNVSGLQEGDILGHEAMGIVDTCGSGVKTLKPGDRVVLPFVLACPTQEQVKAPTTEQAAASKPKAPCANIYGPHEIPAQRLTHCGGGLTGCMAEYVRVPWADYNALKVPDTVADEKVLLLSGAATAAYHSVVDVRFAEGETAAVWGAGPIGQLIAQWLVRVFGAQFVVLIDNVESRLEHAQKTLAVKTINSDKLGKQSVSERLVELCPPHGVDVSFDAAGPRYQSGLLHQAMRAMSLEKQSPVVLNNAILAARPHGRISICADYSGNFDGFDIGHMIEKGLTLKANGQAPVQRYMKKLLEGKHAGGSVRVHFSTHSFCSGDTTYVKDYVMRGVFDPTLVLTHRYDFKDLPVLLKTYGEKKLNERDPLLKCIIETRFSQQPAPSMPRTSKA